MRDESKTVADLKLLGDHVTLDFANTVSWRFREHPDELLTSYAALVEWGEHAGIVTNDEKQQLLEEAGRHPAIAFSVLERAIAVREAIFRIFRAVAQQAQPESSDVATLNSALRDALPWLQIAVTAEGFSWRWRDDSKSLERILWPVIRSAAELLTSHELNRVGICADDGCGWLFFDTSKNRSRRWCAMEDCGNRAKARRHYKQHRIRDRRATM